MKKIEKIKNLVKTLIENFSFKIDEDMDLKQEFLKIQKKYTETTPNPESLRSMREEYSSLFEKSGLKDLEFDIIVPKENPCTMIIHPLRPIDKLAIRGILNLDQ